MKLKSDLIPHNQFHKGIWLKTDICDWFFFYETPRKYLIPQNKNFYHTLDDDLKDIVIFLHSKNIPTTPSCSGHIQNDNHYNDIFSSLLKTTKNIKKEGIDLINPESNRKFFYKNSNYNLPFSRDEFINQLRSYQKKGVLGFVDKENIYDKIKNEVPSERNKDITLVFTEGDDLNQIQKSWKHIHQLMKKVVN